MDNYLNHPLTVFYLFGFLILITSILMVLVIKKKN